MIYTYTIQTQYIPWFALTCTTLVISLFNFVFQIKSLDRGVPKILSFPQHTCSGTLPSGYYFAVEIRLHATFGYTMVYHAWPRVNFHIDPKKNYYFQKKLIEFFNFLKLLFFMIYNNLCTWYCQLFIS